MFRALTKNPRGRATWEFRGSPGGAFDGEHGSILAKVRSSASSQEHLTNSRAKKKNKSRQQHRASTKSQHRCSRNLNTRVVRCPSSVRPGIVSERSQVKDSSRAQTRLLHLPLRQKEGEGHCTSLVGATFFQPSTTWTTLSRASSCPRSQSTMESVGSAHVRVLLDGEDSSATVSSSSSSDGSC